MSTRLASAPAGEGRVWWITAALCAFVVGYVEAVSAILVGLFFCMLAMGFATVRRWPQALSFFGLATVAGIGLFSVLIINYATTGVPLDNVLQWFWPIVDLRRVETMGRAAGSSAGRRQPFIVCAQRIAPGQRADAYLCQKRLPH